MDRLDMLRDHIEQFSTLSPMERPRWRRDLVRLALELESEISSLELAVMILEAVIAGTTLEDLVCAVTDALLDRTCCPTPAA